jgi:SAM-dependent methyltransferase
MWAVAEAASGKSRGLVEAEEWFFRQQSALASAFPASALEEADRHLSGIDRRSLVDLLPYAIDPHGPGTRRSVIRDPLQEVARSAKRMQGIYYTPGDVSDFMAQVVVRDRETRVMDPACGTGVFLRAAARRIGELGGENPIAQVYGVDVDGLAIDGACFVLAAYMLGLRPDDPPWRWWHTARLNIAQRDALDVLLAEESLGRSADLGGVISARGRIRGRIATAGKLPPADIAPRSEWGDSLTSLFPEVRNGFAVLGNPPYAPLGLRPDAARLNGLGVLRGSKVSPSTNAFLPFLEFIWALSAGTSSAALVVPMSLGYNTTQPFRSARRAIRQSGGRWTFRFFDRTPDSLFGDDIKQRTTIVSRDPAPTFSVATSGLTRWTSRQRRTLWETLPRPVDLGGIDITTGVPKVGDQWELDLLRALRNKGERLDETLSFADPDSEGQREAAIDVGSTAYNRLVVYRDGGSDEERVASFRLVSANSTQADWAFALLASTITYWLWRVDGDGFHVPSKWLLGLPFAWRSAAVETRLAQLGRRAWADALDHPVFAVNSGRRTTSYRTSDEVIRQIDLELLARSGFDPGLQEALGRFKSQTIEVGRGSERED